MADNDFVHKGGQCRLRGGLEEKAWTGHCHCIRSSRYLSAMSDMWLTNGLKDPLNYRMQGWPTGYAVFATARGNGDRHDYYLCGGPQRYRSASEFQSHAVWLFFSGNPPDHYEDLFPPKSPRKVSKSKDTNSSGVPRKSSPKIQQPTQSILSSRLPKKKPSTTIKKVAFYESPPATRKLTDSLLLVEPEPRPASPVQEKSDLADRLPQNDGDDFSEESAGNVPPRPTLLTIHPAKPARRVLPSREQINRPSRQYRIGELVWCVINPPLRDNESGAVIDQWPGIVAVNRVKKTVKSANNVEEEELYQINLLALKDSFVLPHSGLSPYRAYIPQRSLIALLQSFPPPSISDLPTQLHHFHMHLPYLSIQHYENDTEIPDDPFLQAWGPYSLALQNAARLAMTWGFAYPHEPLPFKNQSEEPLSFSALWWGAELLLIEEMAMLICDRARLAQHRSLHGLTSEDGDQERAVLLQIRRIEARARNDQAGGRAVLVGMLYELAPLLSNDMPDSAASMPKQAAPFGMLWKQLLPPEHEAHVDVEYVEGRYYASLNGPSLEAESKVILSLQGLAPGYFRAGNNAPSIYQNTRGEMARFAETKAYEDLADYWAEKEQSHMQVE